MNAPNASAGGQQQQKITAGGCAGLLVVALVIAAGVGVVVNHGPWGIAVFAVAALAMLLGAMGAFGARAVLATQHPMKGVTATGHIVAALIGIGSALGAFVVALSPHESDVELPLKVAGAGAGIALLVFAAGAAFFRVTSTKESQ